jgi:hypothetical protein
MMAGSTGLPVKCKLSQFLFESILVDCHGEVLETSLLIVFCLYHQQDIAFFNRKVAVFIAIKVGCPVFGFVQIGVVTEVKPKFGQLAHGHPGFSGRVQTGQDSAVFSQGIVDIANIIGFIAVEAIVKTNPTLVAAKLFVGPAFEGFSTLKTYFSICGKGWHKVKVGKYSNILTNGMEKAGG